MTSTDASIKRITLWYNSFLAMEATVSLDIKNGVVRYKSNFTDCMGLENSEGISLRSKQLLQQFAEYAKTTQVWEPYYGTGRCIDGYYWKLTIEFINGSTFESSGENGKPKQFDEFVEKLEEVIEKPIAFK